MKYVLLVLVLVAAIGCVSHDLEGPVVVDCTSVNPISFASDVKPIIDTKCVKSGCHNGDQGADLNWSMLANIQNHKDEMHRRLKLAPSDKDKMPKKGSLTIDQIKTIVCWIEQGALDN